MKAKKLLQLYAEGRRDFRGENLRGQSFRGQNLSGADFSGADIRSTDFTNAYLVGAEFVGVKAGLQKRWMVVLLVGVFALTGISAFLAILFSNFILLIFDSKIENQVTGWVCLIVITVIYSLFAYTKIEDSNALSVVLVLGGAGAFVGAVNFTGVITYSGAEILSRGLAVTVAVAGYGVVAGFVILAVAVAVAVPVTMVLVLAVAITVAIVIAVTLFMLKIIVVGIAFALFQALFDSYVAYQAMKGNAKYTFVYNLAVFVAAVGGTSFRDTDLTNANFTNSILKNTDFRGVNITRTCWRNTIKLDRVRPGETYLKDAKTRELVKTGQGENINLNRFYLQGVNLKGASLKNASFIGANLNKTNLQDADLTNAKLVHTQLDGANLTAATLTGAYIEDWAITTTTKLDGIKCDYVFMRLPPEKRPPFIALPPEENNDPNPRRKPDNWDENFQEGDFADFIKPMQQTLDLYHNRQVDPRAVTIAFNQLAENHPEANLSVAAVEVRGKNNDKILLRAKTSKEANHSELSAEYFENYNNLRSLPSDKLVFLIAEKDKQIRLLAGQVELAIKTPKFYAENYQNQGGTMTETNQTTYHQSGPMGIGHMSGGEIKDNPTIAGIMNTNEEVNNMTDNSKNFSVGGSVGGDIRNSQGDNNTIIEGDGNRVFGKDNDDVIAEVREILQELSQTHPTETMSDRITHIPHHKHTTTDFSTKKVDYRLSY